MQHHHEIEEVEQTVVAIDDDQQVELPALDSSWFGTIPAPKSLSDLWQLLAHLIEGNTHIAGWRGQSDIAWPIHSSAVRRIGSHGAPPRELLPPVAKGSLEGAPIDADNPAALEYFLQQYESYLLNEARLAGHGYYGGRALSDLELLAVLQHYGGATRLLDFSRNVAVALWFACAEHPTNHGLLIAIDASKTRQLISDADTTRSMRETILLQDYPWTFSWQPQHLFERMRVQQSFFLFSRAESREWGSLALPGPKEPNGGLILVAVSPELKSEVARLHQQRMFGFSGLSLFPDLEGFSRFQSANSPYLNLR